MLALARDGGLAVPVLAGAKESNALHLAWIAQAVRRRCPPPGPVLLLGLSFKSGTDDLRNSPLLDLAETLLEGGYDLRVVDPDLDPTRLIGVNFALGLEHQEVLRARLTDNAATAAAGAKLAILGKPMPAVLDSLPPRAARPQHQPARRVLCLTRRSPTPATTGCRGRWRRARPRGG